MMALAGPLANLLVVAAAGLTIRLGMALDWFYAPDRINLSRIVAAH